MSCDAPSGGTPLKRTETYPNLPTPRAHSNTPPTSAPMMCVVAFAAAWLPALPLPRKAAYLRLGGPVLMTEDAEDGDATLTTHYRPRSAPS